MYHLVARTRDRRRLFRTWAEGIDLWERVVEACPGLIALVVMPDHLHLIHPSDVKTRLAHACSRFSRVYNLLRGLHGPLFERLPDAQPIADAEKLRRNIRYVHLNPARAGYVKDPLAWPLSTHRDAVGLAVRGVVPVRRDPYDFHRYVSSDPSTHVDGTELPGFSLSAGSLFDVLHATSAVCRTPLAEMGRRGAARTLFIRAALELCPEATAREIGALVGLSVPTVRRSGERDPNVRIVGRAVGDERFPALADGEVRLVRVPRDRSE